MAAAVAPSALSAGSRNLGRTKTPSDSEHNLESPELIQDPTAETEDQFEVYIGTSGGTSVPEPIRE